MSNGTQEQIKAILAKDSKVFRGLKLPGGDFSGLDLEGADFRGASLVGAKFNEANLKFAHFENANCVGSDFTDAVMHRASLKDTNMSRTKFLPKDAFGLTVTLECKSFQDMEISEGWWGGWLMYGLVMKPPTEEHRARLIQAIGLAQWEILRSQYANRRW